MYVTLKLDDNGVAGFTAFLMMGTNERYGVCPGRWLPDTAKT